MMDLRRWLLRTTTPTRIAGIVLAVSLSGCRSAAVNDESPAGPDFAEPKPVAPYEDAPTAGNDSEAGNGDRSSSTLPPPAPSFEPDTDVARSTPKNAPSFEDDESIEVPPFAGDALEESSIADAPVDAEKTSTEESRPQFVPEAASPDGTRVADSGQDDPVSSNKPDSEAQTNELNEPGPVTQRTASDETAKAATSEPILPVLTPDPLLDESPFQEDSTAPKRNDGTDRTEKKDKAERDAPSDSTVNEDVFPMPMPVLPLPAETEEVEDASDEGTSDEEGSSDTLRTDSGEPDAALPFPSENAEGQVRDKSKPEAAPFLPDSAVPRNDNKDSQLEGVKESTDKTTLLPEITPRPTARTETTPQPQKTGTVGSDDRVALVIRPGRPGSGSTPADTGTTGPQTGTEVRVFAELNGRPDGIVFDQEGQAFVSHRDTISRATADGQIKPWARTGAPRGHVILPDGHHVVCDASQRAVLKLDRSGNVVEKLATRSDGYFLRSPNAIVADGRGGFYFTDPGYARIRNPIGKVHYISAEGIVRPVAQSLAFPEGIALSRDGATLYVAESQRNRILAFNVKSPGDIGSPRVFCDLPKRPSGAVDDFADGIAVDRQGRVFVAHHGMSRIEVIGPDGRWQKSISTSGTVVSDLAFGHDFNRIFVTGAADRGTGRGRLLIIDIESLEPESR